MSSSDDNPAKVTAIRARLDKFASIDAFVEGYNQYFFRGGMLLPTRQSRAVGTPVSLQLEISDGTTVVRADGEVQQVRTNDAGRAVGMVIRFKRVDAATRDLMTRILRERHERRTGAHAVVNESPPRDTGARPARPAPFAPPQPAASKLADEDINAIENALDSTFDSIFGGSGSFPTADAAPAASPTAPTDDELPSPSRTEARDDGPATLGGAGDEETLHGVKNLLGEDPMALRRELAASVESPTDDAPQQPDALDAQPDPAAMDDDEASAEASSPAPETASDTVSDGSDDEPFAVDSAEADDEADDEPTDEPTEPSDLASDDAPALPSGGVPRSTVFGMPAFASGDADATEADTAESKPAPVSAGDILSSLLDDADEAAPDQDLSPASASQPLTRLALQRKSKAELDADRRAALRALQGPNADDQEARDTVEATPLAVDDDAVLDEVDTVEDARVTEVDDPFADLDAAVDAPAEPLAADDASPDGQAEVDLDFDSPEDDEGADESDHDELKDLLHGIAASDEAGPPVLDPQDALRRLEAQTGDAATVSSNDGDDALDALLAEPPQDRPVLPPSVQLAKPPEKKGIFQRSFAWLARLFGGR